MPFSTILIFHFGIVLTVWLYFACHLIILTSGLIISKRRILLLKLYLNIDNLTNSQITCSQNITSDNEDSYHVYHCTHVAPMDIVKKLSHLMDRHQSTPIIPQHRGQLFLSRCCQHHFWNIVYMYIASLFTVYSMYHYVIKFISDLQQVGGFLHILRFPPPIKLTATI